MIFKNFKELAEDVQVLLPKLPRDISEVYGVARSGLLPAAMISTLIGAKLGTIGDNVSRGGWRYDNLIKNKGSRTLLVDDSSFTGSAIQQAKDALGKDCTTCVIYVTEQSMDKVDIYGEVTDPDRIFLWNFLAKQSTHLFSFDLDGAIGTDPDHYDDDGEGYRQSIINAKPLYVPQTKIRMICTNRISRWRPETEAWLAKYNVTYDELIMQPHTTAVERRRGSNPAVFKAENYKNRKESILFVESHSAQAKIIARLSGKPVLSIEEMKLY